MLSSVTLSVAIITKNEEANIRRTLESVRWAEEIVVVDSGSTDRTCEIAREMGAKVFVEEWKGFAAQKNSAIEKCTGDWILSLDADEEVSEELASEIGTLLAGKGRIENILDNDVNRQMNEQLKSGTIKRVKTERGQDAVETRFNGMRLPRRNLFLNRWIRFGGFYPDLKLRLFKKGLGRFIERPVHETVVLSSGISGALKHPLIHHAYPTLSSYIEHMNSYSSLGAEMAVAKGQRGFSILNIVVRPLATFVYNYFFRLGFLDGREGLLLHLYHSGYVSWKYAKAWESGRALKN
jgi:glycosyltransferase involved in cell wall biosynthesis